MIQPVSMKDPSLEQQLLLTTIDDEDSGVAEMCRTQLSVNNSGRAGSSKNASAGGAAYRGSRRSPVLIECETIPEEGSSSPENDDRCCPRPAPAPFQFQLRKQRKMIPTHPSNYQQRQVWVARSKLLCEQQPAESRTCPVLLISEDKVRNAGTSNEPHPIGSFFTSIRRITIFWICYWGRPVDSNGSQ